MDQLLIQKSNFAKFAFQPALRFFDLSKSEFEVVRGLILLLLHPGFYPEDSNFYAETKNVYSALFYDLQKSNPTISNGFLHQELKEKLFSYWILNSEMFQTCQVSFSKFYSYFCEDRINNRQYQWDYCRHIPFLLAPGKSFQNLIAEKENKNKKSTEKFSLDNFSSFSQQSLIDFLLSLDTNNLWIKNFLLEKYFSLKYDSSLTKEIYFEYQGRLQNIHYSKYKDYTNLQQEPVWERKELTFQLRVSEIQKEVVPVYKEYSTDDLKCKIISEIRFNVFCEFQVWEKQTKISVVEVEGKKFSRQEKKEVLLLDWASVLDEQKNKKQFVFPVPIIEKSPVFLVET